MILLQTAIMALALGGVAVEMLRPPSHAHRWVPAGLAVGLLLALGWLVTNHIGYPFHLHLMEGVMQQHLEQLMAGLPLYPAPTAEFVPFAYHPLYYYVALPFTWLGATPLPALRLAAAGGLLVALVATAGWVHDRTGSWWWALVAAGLLAGSYGAMDAHLDTAQPDSWLLAATLLGGWLLDRSRGVAGSRSRGVAGSRGRGVVGMMVLVAGFWFKQHGALFVLAGLGFLAWRDGRRSWPAWAAVLLAGAGPWVFGNALFGPWFRFFTWTVPSGWSAPGMVTITRPALFLLEHYPVLLLAGLCGLLAWRARRPDMLAFGLLAALAAAMMGALDRGSSDNVFIPAGAWLIVAGSVALAGLERGRTATRQLGVPLLVALSFAVRLYDPREVTNDPSAPAAYAGLVDMLRNLEGGVYAPWTAELPGHEVPFTPAFHWVALEDIERSGGGREKLAQELLDAALSPDGPGWMLANHRLGNRSPLTEVFVLDADLRNRFQALRYLPGRFDHGYPRFLYVRRRHGNSQ